MTLQPPDYPEDPPDPEGFEILPCAPEAEQDLVGAVLYDAITFERANLKSSDFYIHRWRWFWEACEAIQAAKDAIDYGTLEKELIRSGRWQEFCGGHDLVWFLKTTTLHVEANARLVRDRARRRRMIADATGQAKRAFDLNIPLPPDPAERKTEWTLAELARTEFPELKGPIPELILNGLTVLGGRPKRGKSWLMLQASYALAVGGKFLGRDLAEHKVLYYALEDHPRRLKERIAALGQQQPEAFQFRTALQALHLGGLEEIRKAIQEQKFKLVVIDTLWRAMPGLNPGKNEALFSDILGQLQQLAIQNEAAVVVILHTRKNQLGSERDPVDDVMGTTHLVIGADAVLALYPEKGKKATAMKGRYRDREDLDELLQFDPLTGGWQSLGEAGEVKVRETEEEILAALKTTGKATVGKVVKMIGKDFSNTSKRMNTLWVKGIIRMEEIENKTYYYLPGRESENCENTYQPTNYQ